MTVGDRTEGFVTDLDVRHIDAKWWKVLADLRFVGWKKGDIFEVKAGELTDFATVPWFVQFILPRIGKWTKAAVLHDMMCRVLREWFYQDGSVYIEKPAFTSIDADAIFRENARREGTDVIRAEMLWFGVRCGSLWDAHRRDEWWKTLPRFTFDLLWILGLLAAILAIISWAWPW